MSQQGLENDDVVDLWAREETPVLTLPLPLTSVEGDAEKELPSTLQLRQYGSQEETWGIHGTVWDGGIALISYISTCWQQQPTKPRADCGDEDSKQRSFSSQSGKIPPQSYTVIDLGSGTGCVGLGLFLMNNYKLIGDYTSLSRNMYETIFLTDLPEALPLLEENKRLNPLSKKPLNDCQPHCHVCKLIWGEESLPEAIQAALAENPNGAQSGNSSSNVLVTGADIVYRQNLFEPLLKTLRQLATFFKNITFLFSSQSIRSHLQEFWDLSRREGWRVIPRATVLVSEDPSAIPVLQEEFEERSTTDDKYDPWEMVRDKRAPGIVIVYELILL
jgi:hypothetical protein